MEGVRIQLARKNLHSAPLDRTDANEGGRPGGGAACFNSTFLTLLLAGGASTSPSAGGPEGPSPGRLRSTTGTALVL